MNSLYDQALEAIMAVFEDMEATKEEAYTNLNSLKNEIENLLATLE